MSRVNVRVDEKLKEDATELFHELGFDMTTAITTFLCQSVREQRLPFQPSKNPVLPKGNQILSDSCGGPTGESHEKE